MMQVRKDERQETKDKERCDVIKVNKYFMRWVFFNYKNVLFLVITVKTASRLPNQVRTLLLFELSNKGIYEETELKGIYNQLMI